MGNSAYFVIKITQTGVLFLAILLHSLGMYLLKQIKETRTNQNTILMHLSLIEIITSSFVIIFNVSTHFKILDVYVNYNFALSFHLFGEGIYLIFYFIMIILTIDKVAVSLLSLKYGVIMTCKKTKIILTLCWLIGIICGGIFIALRSTEIPSMIHIIADGCFLILAVTTYIFILYQIHKRRKLLQTNTNTHSMRDNNRGQIFPKFYVVTGLVVLSFILFVAIPTIFKFFTTQLKPVEVAVLQLLWSLNDIVDPCIYIFLQKPVRILLGRKMKTRRNTKKNSSVEKRDPKTDV